MHREALDLINDQAGPIEVRIEPWGTTIPLEPGTSLHVVAQSQVAGRMEVVHAPGEVGVFAWSGCTVQVFRDEALVQDLLTPAPGLTDGMSTRQTLHALFGAPREATTGLAVRRARDYCGVSGAMRVLIDDRAAGSINYGDRAEFPLQPGRHTVRVSMDWCRSEPFELQIHEGEVAELEGGLRWRGLAWRWSVLAMFVAPWWVFVVRPVDPRATADRWRSTREGIGVAAGALFTIYLGVQLVMWLNG